MEYNKEPKPTVEGMVVVKGGEVERGELQTMRSAGIDGMGD